MAKNLLEKSIASLEAEPDIDEKIKAYQAIKEVVAVALIAHQQELQNTADETQALIDRMRG